MGKLTTGCRARKTSDPRPCSHTATDSPRRAPTRRMGRAACGNIGLPDMAANEHSPPRKMKPPSVPEHSGRSGEQGVASNAAKTKITVQQYRQLVDLHDELSQAQKTVEQLKPTPGGRTVRSFRPQPIDSQIPNAIPKLLELNLPTPDRTSTVTAVCNPVATPAGTTLPDLFNPSPSTIPAAAHPNEGTEINDATMREILHYITQQCEEWDRGTIARGLHRKLPALSAAQAAAMTYLTMLALSEGATTATKYYSEKVQDKGPAAKRYLAGVVRRNDRLAAKVLDTEATQANETKEPDRSNPAPSTSAASRSFNSSRPPCNTFNRPFYPRRY